MVYQLRLKQLDNRLSEEDCLELITEPLRKNKEGFFHLWIGYSGWGKTVANSILYDYIRSLSSMEIVVDQKNKECLYSGTQIANLRELPDVKDSNVVIRGAAMTKRASDILYFDSLAEEVWNIGQRTECPVSLFPDELTDACTAGQSWKSPTLTRVDSKGKVERYKDPWMDKLYRQGRVLGISICAATQLIQEVPSTALAMSETIGVFRQRGRELAYLERLGYLDSSTSQIVANLDKYDFLLIRRGEEARVCRFDYSGM